MKFSAQSTVDSPSPKKSVDSVALTCVLCVSRNLFHQLTPPQTFNLDLGSHPVVAAYEEYVDVNTITIIPCGHYSWVGQPNLDKFSSLEH